MSSESTPRTRICIIHNPAAGRNAGRFLDACLEELRGLRVEFELMSTQAPGHATSLAQWAVKKSGFDAVAVAGGDGTLNEAANGLTGQTVPMGILPVGTANVLAGEIGLRRSPRIVARTLAFGPARLIYPGKMNGKYFLLMASAGYDARSVKNLPSDLKPRLGKGTYFVSALREIFRYAPPYLSVRIGEEIRNAQWVVVSRSRYYAGTFCLSPDADLGRQEYVVSFLPARTRLQLLGTLFRILRSGLMEVSFDRVVTGEKITLDCLDAEPLQMDGDPAEGFPANFTPPSLPLNLICPPD